MTATAARNLRRVSDDIWRRHLDGEHMTGCEMKADYDLTDAQFNYVKRQVKELALKKGTVWGYHPAFNNYQIAPDNAPAVARPILEYQLRHWRDEGKSAVLTIEAAAVQGYVSNYLRNQVRILGSDFDQRIERLELDLDMPFLS